MKVYVVISSYQHGLGEAVEVDAEVFSTIDKARKAIRHKGMNTLENYKRVLNCDDYLYNISDSFFHISDSEGETWDNFDVRTRSKVIRLWILRLSKTS